MATSSEQPAQSSASTSKPAPLPAMTIQQEDSIIHTRITNDEKALRRVTKKFHSYVSAAYDTVVPPAPAHSGSVDDAREAFLVELASFHLSLKKSLMVCEAEARQVEEYQREKERIENERVQLRDQIEELKHSLEQAQIMRRRKMEYDVIAEKINTLPSRDELEGQIKTLESDIATIRAEQEDQVRILLAQQSALDGIISSIQELRTVSKQDILGGDAAAEDTPAPESQNADGDVDMGQSTQESQEETGEIREELEQGHTSSSAEPLSSRLLNPSAQPFVPGSSSMPRMDSPDLSSEPTPLPSSDLPQEEPEEGETEDIEMGELAEEPGEKPQPPKKKVREELEEGEASDSDLGSELTDISDD